VFHLLKIRLYRKKAIDQELAEIEPLLKEAREAVSEIRNEAISEIRSVFLYILFFNT